MPRIDTQTFGPIAFEPGSEFVFPQGIPGFEEERRFLPVEHPSYAPLLFLQSLGRPELCFLTLPVFVVDPSYRLELSPEERAALGLDGEGRTPEIGRDVLCLAVLTVPEHGAATANLLAPLVVNIRTRVGAQLLQCESGYSHQHPVDPAAAAATPQQAAPCS